jgi:hypothetical protein
MSATKEVDTEVEAKAERVIELDERLRLHECFWSVGLIPTEAIITDYDELIEICNELLPHAKGDPTEFERMIRRYKRKRGNYRTRLKEERKDAAKEEENERG